ncbi:MAG: glycosyltransferase family 2 protein [Anaerolineae bacterium]
MDLTIGITAYREGDLLRRCWQSVLAQTDPRWQAVLIVDGGADRRTRRIAAGLEHPRLRVVQLPENGGPYAARTRAIRAAGTPWYAHLDADDTLPPRAAASILAAIEAHPQAQYICGAARHTGPGWAEIREPHPFDRLTHGPTFHAQAPIRVELFERVGGFAPQLMHGSADWDFWLSVAALAVPGARAEGIIYERHNRPGSNGDRWRLHRHTIARIVIDRHPAFFADPARRRATMGRAHERVARAYRERGQRIRAADHARQALAHGTDTPTLRAIRREADMAPWRYALRRLGRLMSAGRDG